MFVQLAVVQKETFLITIPLWEGPIAQSGESFKALFAASVFSAEAGLSGRQFSLTLARLKLASIC